MAMNLDEFRSRLEQERKRLTGELEKLQASPATTDTTRGSWFGQRGEQASEAAELERRLLSERRLNDHLAKVEHALHKFEEGTYGLCEQCSKPIDPARLEALPYANLCLNCKAHCHFSCY